MVTRTGAETVVFAHPFSLKGIDRLLPAGDYRVVTDEDLIEGLSFPVYRRTSTMMLVPGPSRHAASVEMVSVDPVELRAALERDSAPQGPAPDPLLGANGNQT